MHSPRLRWHLQSTIAKYTLAHNLLVHEHAMIPNWNLLAVYQAIGRDALHEKSAIDIVR